MSEVVYTKEEKKKRVLGIVGASSGNLVEWFDFYIYAVFAMYFQHALTAPDMREFMCGVYSQQVSLCAPLVVGYLDGLQINMVENSRW